MSTRAIRARSVGFRIASPGPLFRRALIWMLVMSLVAVVTATLLHLEVPAPTGSHAVGRQSYLWVDESRPEAHTVDHRDRRSVPVLAWYPAEADSGRASPYVPNLTEIADQLVESGELSAIEVTALQLVRHDSREGAEPVQSADGHPVVIFSPGNQTNVVFYSAIAEELASHGYVVVGIDHPYQVAATATRGGLIAGYDDSWDGVGGQMVSEKVSERVADIEFVLESLALGADRLTRTINVNRVAVVGHSNGGLAAVEACRRMPALVACANLDGQGGGGPLSTDPAVLETPLQPYLFLTKEADLHPTIDRAFENGGEGGFRIVIPAAKHDSFTDGSLFRPGINPLARESDAVMEAARGFLRSFLDLQMGRGSPDALGTLPISTDAYVNVYPLGGEPPIPASG